ncbi:MAG: pyrimidine-nucleoside phosphorylase [Lachnospirales bacterium]
MRMIDVIIKKKDNIELSEEEINWVIENYTNGEIPDYQMSSLLMAIVFNDMTKNERLYLTNAIVNSGVVTDLTGIKGIKVDKHSTGGVGDKTTLVLAPLVSSCGVPVAKMSGRGLGHTGGTLDKIEAIPGASVDIEINDFIKQVNEIGIAVIGQTGELAPADKKLYALRDVTGTVESIPLIASSIMSKKLASGADAIVLDVKVGTGAFMKTIERAEELAQAMVDIGNGAGRKTTACITSMDEPLGLAVGNTLEVIEAINTLKGNAPSDLLEVVLELGSHMVVNGGKAKTYDEAKTMLMANIENGKGLEQLKKFIKMQHGDEKYIEDTELFEKAKYLVEVKATKSGYISKIDAYQVGIACMQLGAGRATKDSVIDMAVGTVLYKKQADKVEKGEVLAVIHSNREDVSAEYSEILDSYKIVDEKVKKTPIIYSTVE